MAVLPVEMALRTLRPAVLRADARREAGVVLCGLTESTNTPTLVLSSWLFLQGKGIIKLWA